MKKVNLQEPLPKNAKWAANFGFVLSGLPKCISQVFLWGRRGREWAIIMIPHVDPCIPIKGFSLPINKCATM